tara:strand:+ start:139 stop:594 length:456 start_codon:yes stop_codon:yes gene_type:complete
LDGSGSRHYVLRATPTRGLKSNENHAESQKKLFSFLPKSALKSKTPVDHAQDSLNKVQDEFRDDPLRKFLPKIKKTRYTPIEPIPLDIIPSSGDEVMEYLENLTLTKSSFSQVGNSKESHDKTKKRNSKGDQRVLFEDGAERQKSVNVISM